MGDRNNMIGHCAKMRLATIRYSRKKTGFSTKTPDFYMHQKQRMVLVRYPWMEWFLSVDQLSWQVRYPTNPTHNMFAEFAVIKISPKCHPKDVNMSKCPTNTKPITRLPLRSPNNQKFPPSVQERPPSSKFFCVASLNYIHHIFQQLNNAKATFLSLNHIKTQIFLLISKFITPHFLSSLDTGLCWQSKPIINQPSFIHEIFMLLEYLELIPPKMEPQTS